MYTLFGKKAYRFMVLLDMKIKLNWIFTTVALIAGFFLPLSL